MGKVLVIEDEEEFRKRLNLATIQSTCVVADVMSLLKDYEQDVIEFKADKQKARAWGELRRWLEVTIPVAEMHKNGTINTAKIKIYLTDVLVKMDKLLKGENHETDKT